MFPLYHKYSLISFFMQITENISYDPLKLPEPVHSKIAESLGKLLKLADSDSRKLESHILAVGGSLPKPLNVTVSAVKYGFKAPVAMLLAPYWALLLKDFKMLHVLRDGRDIAFSANQVCISSFSFLYLKYTRCSLLNIPYSAERLLDLYLLSLAPH